MRPSRFEFVFYLAADTPPYDRSNVGNMNFKLIATITPEEKTTKSLLKSLKQQSKPLIVDHRYLVMTMPADLGDNSKSKS